MLISTRSASNNSAFQLLGMGQNDRIEHRFCALLTEIIFFLSLFFEMRTKKQLTGYRSFMTIKWHFVQNNYRVHMFPFDIWSKGNENLQCRLPPCRSISKLLHLIFFLGLWKASWGLFPEFSFSTASIGAALYNCSTDAASGLLSTSIILREFCGFSLGLSCILSLNSS